MAESCRIIPHVINPRGEEVESNLYNGLKGLFSHIGKGGRNYILPLYQKTLNPKFKSDMKDRGALFDDNGEITLYDFISRTDAGSEISDNDIVDYLNDDFKDKTFTKSEAFDNATKFNNSIWNRNYVAIPSKVGKNKFSVRVEVQNTDKPENYKRVIFAGRLSNRLEKQLKEWGIGTDVYDELEDSITHGYIDFEETTKLPDGLIHLIKIAKGNTGKMALPEEFAHFVVRSMINTPLISRALNQIKENNLYETILGDELETYRVTYSEQARERNIPIEDLLAEEALGKILANKIENQWVNSSLIERIFNLFKSIFSKFDENRIQDIALDCDKELNVLVKDILDGKCKNMQTSNLGIGKLYRQASARVKQTRSKWDKFYETMLRTNIIYNKRRRELGLTSEEGEEDLLESQYEVIEKLDIAAHKDWSTPYQKRDKNGVVIEVKNKEEYLVDAAVSLMELAIKNTEKILKTVNELREQIDNGSYRGNLNIACAKVRAIMDYIEAYSEIYEDFDSLIDLNFRLSEWTNYPEIEQIRNDLREEANLLRGQLEEIRGIVLGQKSNRRAINTNVKNRDEYYKRPLAIEIFLQGFRQFFPEDVVLAFGHTLNGEILTLEEMLTFADYDVNFISTWANSMANTSDPIARMYDAIVKKQKDEARQECTDIIRRIKDAGKKLEKFGFSAREHSWMYDTYTDDVYGFDTNGNRILIHKKGELILDSNDMPSYIKEYDEAAAKEDLTNFTNRLRADKTLSNEEKTQRYKEFIETHYDERRGQMYPKSTYYPSKNYLALTDEQKEFYHTFMDCKRQLDKYLPIFTNDSHKAIVVRRDAFQRLMSFLKLHKNDTDIHVGDLWDSLKDWASEKFTRKETDDEFGEIRTLTNFSGKEVRKIPIYYTYKDRKSPLFNYSTNLVANMCLYAHTATNYKAMAKVIETLELGHDILNFRLTVKRTGKIRKMLSINDGARILKDNLYIDAAETNFSKRLSNYLDMQVYGVKKENRSKIAEIFARFVGGFTTAASALVGITNLLQGLGQINIEMLAGENFTTGDLLKAKAFYWSHILPTILDSFKMVKTSKMTILSEDFNMMQDWDTELKDMGQYEKNPLARLSISKALYILNHIGEHYMQHITFLAMLNHEKIIDGNGKYVSVLDAYEKVPLKGSESSYRLALKHYNGPYGKSQTYKTKDGKTIVTFEQLKARQKSYAARGKNYDLYSKALLKDGEISEYEFKGRLSRKGAKVNQDMHGIYNEDDKNMLQQKALGSLLIMYRKHIAPNYMKRYKNEWYDFDLDRITTGYQRELPKLFLDFFRKATDPVTGDKKWAIKTWSKHDRANFIRNAAQALNWLEINLLISILETGIDDNDDDLWYKLLLISAYRAKTENSQFEPLAIFAKHNILEEWVRLIEQPVVGTNIIKNFVELFRLTDPEVWEHKMESGPYKGKLEAEKILFNCLPIVKQLHQHSDPDELLKFYRRDVGSSSFTDYFASAGNEFSNVWNE